MEISSDQKWIFEQLVELLVPILAVVGLFFAIRIERTKLQLALNIDAKQSRNAFKRDLLIFSDWGEKLIYYLKEGQKIPMDDVDVYHNTGTRLLKRMLGSESLYSLMMKGNKGYALQIGEFEVRLERFKRNPDLDLFLVAFGYFYLDKLTKNADSKAKWRESFEMLAKSDCTIRAVFLGDVQSA